MRLRAEPVLAWAGAGVGVVAVVSALTPALADRYDVVRGVLPAGIPSAARVVTLAFGLGLVWLSRSLAQRRRRAWQLAVVVVIGLSVSHLVKGLDFEEALVTLALLVALARYRRRFDVPGDPLALGPFAVTLAALAAAGGWSVWLETNPAELPDRVEDAVAAVSFLLAFRVLYLWLRPLSQRVRQSSAERRAVHDLVATYGRDSLAYFTLRRDKSYFFSPSRRAFLAYRVVGGAALISGDPVGDADEFDSLLDEFGRMARASGWCIAVLGASAEQLSRYRRLGLKAIKLGDEAVLRPDSFSLEGRPIRKVRQSVSRLTKAGYRLRVVDADAVDAPLLAQIEEVSSQWRGNQPERGFTMSMDELYSRDTLLAVAEDEHGAVGGFLHLVPSPASSGYSLSTMRRRRDTPNGLMEFLIVETLAWARAVGASEISLNFCAFSDLLQPELRGWQAVARGGLRRLDRLFQLDRLHSFNKKFFPEWRPRYICVERLSDLPRVGLAYLRVESLLVPPGPWARPPKLPA